MERDDLRAAVSAGIIDEVQAARLIALTDSRKGAREDLTPGDEPFELFKGFNEIFIVVGLCILAAGWAGTMAVMVGQRVRDVEAFLGFTSLFSAGVLWVLAEYFIRHRRMVAPAITLTIFWGWNSVGALAGILAETFMVARGDLSSLPTPFGLATASMLIFWLRFRVPFALPLAVLGVFASLVAAFTDPENQPENIRDFFILTGEGVVPWLALGLGIIVFLIAMAFDMSDPHRVTRRSSNGFWLHIVAAPAIVNTVSLTLLTGEGTVLPLSLFLAFIALVAIIIDRRSFLIAAVGYVVAMATALTEATSVAWVILAIGATLVLLGALWEKIRAQLLRGLAPVLPLSRLPPG